MESTARRQTGTTRDRIEALEQAISGLDPTARRAVAGVLRFALDLVQEEAAPKGRKARDSKSLEPQPAGIPEKRLGRSPRLPTPGDNLLLCVARLLARRGKAPITVQDVRDQAERQGLAIPSQPGNTFRFARHGGAPMFRHESGAWHLTPAGMAYVRAMYRPERAPSARAA